MKEMNPTVHKDTIEIYRIRGLKHGYWADISLDEAERAGRISISSSNGNWSYYWGACGESFKRFLIGLDIYYAAGKFRCGHVLDLPATINSWKRQLLSERREEYLDAEEARELYDEIDRITAHVISRSDLEYELFNSNSLMKFFDFNPDIATKVDTQFEIFWSHIWPHFITALKEEQ